MQNHEHKRRALLTLLPLLIYDVEETQKFTRAPDAESGRSTSRGESLVRATLLYDALCRRWQLATVRGALENLWDYQRPLALAVWYQHVSPWPEYHPDQREDMAERGVDWMVGNIRVTLLEYIPNRPKTPISIQRRDIQIMELKEGGWKTREIAQRFDITEHRVKQIVKRQRDALRADTG